jgi:hypothetical protein
LTLWIGKSRALCVALALVMAGLVPAIHVLLAALKQDVDTRDKRGHDG